MKTSHSFCLSSRPPAAGVAAPRAGGFQGSYNLKKPFWIHPPLLGTFLDGRPDRCLAVDATLAVARGAERAGRAGLPTTDSRFSHDL
ncbi:hypothetical protein EVAR_74974_1 [Eumeta japonica]|uniref:Uncharacterized protein n=1 Tax=Eumeta variegata TaxID=151549 RepID=A0A4C1VA54_EUMVA|nr:hypothetical protein EVAR_74974_1 [Eumeta japonica]